VSRLARRLVPESIVYGLGGVANQTVAILLVPIYARHLGPEGVGVSAVVNTTVALALMLVSLALPHAFFRWFLSEARGPHQQTEVLANTFGLRILSSVLGALVVTVAVVPLTALLYGGMENLPIFLLIGPIVLFDSLNSIPLSYLRAVRRARAYALISFTRAALGSVLILYLVVVADLGVLGIVIGSALSAGVGLSVSLLALRGSGAYPPRLDRPLLRAMLAFCLPLVPAAVAGWALNLSDRYILQLFTDEQTVGVYALGYTAGLVVSALVIQPFTLTWAAASWEVAREEDAPATFARLLTGFTGVACLAALGLSALGTDAIRLLVGPAFENSRFIVPFSAFAYVLYGIYTVTSVGVNIRQQTRWVPIYLGVTALAAIGANLLLIPLIGMLGAAVTTLGSYALLAVLSTIVGQRFYPVPWDVPRVVAALVIGFGLSAAALLGPDELWWRVASLLVYPPILVLVGITPLRDLRSLLRALRSRSGVDAAAS
jgi:O-antigen/teichoic acid export membrane protein